MLNLKLKNDFEYREAVDEVTPPEDPEEESDGVS